MDNVNSNNNNNDNDNNDDNDGNDGLTRQDSKQTTERNSCAQTMIQINMRDVQRATDQSVLDIEGSAGGIDY